MIAFLYEFLPEYCFKIFPFSFPEKINFFYVIVPHSEELLFFLALPHGLVYVWFDL